jgi:hypothetical protein
MKMQDSRDPAPFRAALVQEEKYAFRIGKS